MDAGVRGQRGRRGASNGVRVDAVVVVSGGADSDGARAATCPLHLQRQRASGTGQAAPREAIWASLASNESPPWDPWAARERLLWSPPPTIAAWS